MFETIVALATPPLKSALAVIRLSGDDCFGVVNKCFNKDISDIKEKTIFTGSIYDSDKKIDDVVLLVYKGPKSFTGEDLIEIICHGSVLIANEIIQTLIKCGARMATNGEFSSRAFLHHKIDLVQAEAINDVINATTSEAKNLSLLSLNGKTSSLILPLKTRLADLLSLIEVNIDFPEYVDIEVANKEMVVTTADEVIQQINTLISNSRKAKIVKDGIKAAIVGKPNVGKSSLLNALLGENKAIVTDIAGTTRDIVEGEVNLKGIRLFLLDTAGIRETSDKVESIGVDKAKQTIDEADLVIVVLDASKKIDEEDQQILTLAKSKNHIIVYNKNDKNIGELKGKLCISALNKKISPLVDAIYKNLGIDEKVFKQPALNNTRQIGLLERTKLSLLKAKEDANNDLSIDLISVSLLDAYNSLREILGETNQADLSKEVFSRFCVGK